MDVSEKRHERLGEYVVKVTCILTSYNRPKMIQDALKSVADQTHKDYELLVFDDSTAMDIRKIVSEFSLTEVQVFHTDVSPKTRGSICRLSVNCNAGLAAAKGDLLCFLADDDYYYPRWFEAAVSFFENNSSKEVAYGRLWYSDSAKMVFPSGGKGIFPGKAVTKPLDVLDHNQVIHRRFTPSFRWPEEFKFCTGPDGKYFELIAKSGRPFHPIEADAAVKRKHSLNLQKTIREMGLPAGERLRER